MATTTMVLPMTKLVMRLSKDAIRKRKSRNMETQEQRAPRLSKQRDLTTRNRANETEEQVKMRLAKDSNRKALSRLNLNELKKYQLIQKANIRRRIRTKEKLTKTNPWPAVIPYNYKCQCLENFTNCMSKLNLTESTCALCNIRVFSQHMVRVPMITLKNELSLRPHIDIAKIIPGYENLIIDDENYMELKQNNILYESITINFENLNDLPDNDILEPLWATREEHSNINEVVDQREGYVSDPLIEANEHGERIGADVIPVNVSGVLDVKGTSITSEDINYHLLQRLRVNSAKSSITLGEKDLNDDDVVYMIPHGSKPTNEYLNSNLLPDLYPTLFPYSFGGLEDSSRPVKVSMKDHVRYLLN
ncbi:unnamed protein product [Rotaria sp. Silwood2]|nr:unnamed protein product [Rotaria sp. Silwood2]CAF4045047.1 unnamed protein product [Rotaria sp. Silwood2]CAF4370705.1 unnamed protein product [Rotaria sp. Silwood2]